MKTRTPIREVRGRSTVDGAGVRLVRVLGPSTVEDFDPFLMLDSFDSRNPEDYIAGFPMHPHRGIETVTYLVEGEIEHEDTLGNKGTIHAGESQWMTAGSGIMHQEMPKASERMLGLQIWLNLPSWEKMTHPRYFDISAQVRQVDTPTGPVRVISGAFEGVKGVTPRHLQATMLDVTVEAGKTLSLPTKAEENVFIFLLEGAAVIDDREIPEKTAVLFGGGDQLTVSATAEHPVRFLFFSGEKLQEPVAWGGPIVMNTEEELETAFDELREGVFIKENAV